MACSSHLASWLVTGVSLTPPFFSLFLFEFFTWFYSAWLKAKSVFLLTYGNETYSYHTERSHISIKAKENSGNKVELLSSEIRV